MKATILTAFTLITLSVNAQTDSSYNKKQDTIKIGNMVIVGANGTKEVDKVSWNHDSANKRNKRNGIYIKSFNDTIVSINDDTVKVGRINIINKNERDASYGNKNWDGMLDGDFKKTRISIDKGRKENKRIMTNWWILDLGFANYVDHTTPIYYTAIPINGLMPRYVNSSDLKLNNVKSSNVNVWIVQQKANLYKHYLNLKYGVGFEMYNFRFEQPISFTKAPNSAPYFDNVTFSKNKLFVEYLTVPVQLNFQSNPDNSKSFYASIGVSAGYLLQSHTKQISEERGKRKLNGNFNLNNFKMATIGELGIGNIRLYGSFNTTNLFDKNLTHFDMTPFAVGVRFSKF
jgi:hypothetical protein